MGVSSAPMSESTVYAILLIGTFPALWLFAWWLDRVWPSHSELEARRAREAKKLSREEHEPPPP